MSAVRKSPKATNLKKRSSSEKTRRQPPVPPSRVVDTVLLWLPKHSLAIFLLLLLIGTLRIISTYSVFSHTMDEPAHIAAGLEWLSKGVYQYEAQHPPLARIAVALGPYLSGFRSSDTSNMWTEGLRILYRDGRYDRTLALARVGVLPFFWVACLVVYFWGKRYLGEPGTAFAVLCFTFLPPILAHSGLATTDMALTATLSAAFLTAMVWLDHPSPIRSLVLGGAVGLAVLSKFSALPFLVASLGAALLWYIVTDPPRVADFLKRTKSYALPFSGAAVVALMITWGGYRFSFGPEPALPPIFQPVEVSEGSQSIPLSTFRVPAPELFLGIREVMGHNERGQGAYLLGNHSDSGWWWFYLVALAVKTPLPLLALPFCAVFFSSRQRIRGIGLAWAFSLGILAFSSFFSRINIGVRHVLPVYVGFAIVSGAGAAQLLESARTSRSARWVLGVLLLWLAATSALSHPDYLAYFNALCGRGPEKCLVDSDLDWGQDMKRLAKRLREVNASEVAFAPFFPGDPRAAGLPPVHPFDPEVPLPGWNAVNLTWSKGYRFGYRGSQRELKLWPEQIPPTEKIGKGIWLWYFPPNVVPKVPEVR